VYPITGNPLKYVNQQVIKYTAGAVTSTLGLYGASKIWQSHIKGVTDIQMNLAERANAPQEVKNDIIKNVPYYPKFYETGSGATTVVNNHSTHTPTTNINTPSIPDKKSI
jgi:hypothetical protein